MRDILEALKDWFIRKLEPSTCLSCEVLREELEYERDHSDYLTKVLFTNARLVSKEEISGEVPVNFKPVRPRRMPWRARRKEVEKNHKEPSETKAELTDAEVLFEKTLKETSASSN